MENKFKIISQFSLIALYFSIISLPDAYYYFRIGDGIFSVLAFVFCFLSLCIPLYFLRNKINLYLIILSPFVFISGLLVAASYLYEVHFSSDLLLLLFDTNRAEASELIGGSLIYFITFSIIPISLGIFLIRKIPKQLPKKLTLLISLCSALLFLSIYITYNKFSYDDTNSPKLVNNFFPLNTYSICKNFYKEQKSMDNKSLTLANVSYSEVFSDSIKSRKIIVLVIGETSRADNWSLNGYHRNTNPLLSKAANLIYFNNAAAAGVNTGLSVPLILTGLAPEQYATIMDSPGLVRIFKQAGFKTITITNNSDNGGVNDKHYEYSDTFINTMGPIFKSNVRALDIELVSIMNKLIHNTTENCFIILHLAGSHFDYSARYPKNFGLFKPDNYRGVSQQTKNNLINAYDNSILYTDFVLDSTIKVLNKGEFSALMLYTSDHGENLFDNNDKFFHSMIPTYYTAHIPFLTYANDSYISNYQSKWDALQSNTAKKISNNMTFETLIDLAGISYLTQKQSNSVASKNFIESPQIILGGESKTYKYQELKK